MFKITFGTTERKIPIVFPNIMVHELVAKAFYPVMQQHWKKAKIELVSAGEYNPMNSTCSGESSTLAISADPKDGDIILAHDYLHGVVA